MKNFNAKRFAALLRHDAVSNWRGYAGFAFGVFFAHLIGQVGMAYGAVAKLRPGEALDLDYAMSALTPVAHFTAVAALTIGASLMFANMGRKARRIAYLMLPASNWEKYLSRLLLLTVGAAVAGSLCFIAADALRMLLLSGMAHTLPSAVPYAAHDVWIFLVQCVQACGRAADEWNAAGYWKVLFLAVLVLFHFLAFVLGAAAFRRFAFLKTAGCMVALTLVFVMLSSKWHFVDAVFHGNGRLLLPYVGVAGLAVCIAMLWGSYRLFTRIGVTRRRLF